METVKGSVVARDAGGEDEPAEKTRFLEHETTQNICHCTFVKRI